MFHQMSRIQQERVVDALGHAIEKNAVITASNRSSLIATTVTQRNQPAVSKPRSAARSRLIVGVFALIIVAIYACPFYLESRSIGRQLPPLFAADLYTYLNLSNLTQVSPDTTLNPWYGVPVSSNSILYKKFGLSFLIFHWLWRAVGSNWFMAVLIWNLVWVLVIFASGLKFFCQIGCDRDPLLLLGSLGLLLLMDLQSLSAVASAWLHFPSLGRFESFTLPYMRTFFPQVAIPLVLLYLSLQIKVLEEKNRRPWVLMAVIQTVAVAIFPYAALLMIGITASIMLTSCCSRNLSMDYKYLGIFGIVCALVDIAYMSYSGVSQFGGASRTTILNFDGLLLLHLVKSKTLFLLVGATIAASVLGYKSRPQVKWTVTALGSATALLLLADAFVSPGFQISNHGSYFVHLALAILLVTVATSTSALFQKFPRFPSRMLVVIVFFLIVHGVLTARGTYARFLPFNATQAETAGGLKSEDLGQNDLVIANARFVDDTTSWIPLLSSATVLFCRNAEFVLTAEQEEKIQPYREAIYLYLTGHDRVWLDKTLSPAGSIKEQEVLSLTQRRQLLEGPHRDSALFEMRNTLGPFLSRIENQDPDTVLFFRKYARILVLDATERPIFATSRLENYIQITRSKKGRDIVLSWYTPR
jgi:hypothetical protein